MYNIRPDVVHSTHIVLRGNPLKYIEEEETLELD